MQLTRREKVLIIGAAALIGIFAAFQILVKPAIHRVETLKRVLDEKKETLRELRAKSEEYIALREELSGIRTKVASQRKDFGILSFLERAGKESGLAQSVAYMKPTNSPINDSYVETKVEIKLENVSLEQITQFLLRIQSSEALLGVGALRMRKAAKVPELLDAVVEISTLGVAEKD